MPAREALPIRFWRRVRTVGGCWDWTGCRSKKGYGRLGSGVGNQTIIASRVAYELAYGPIPIGLEIDHLCRNPSCVRFDHLEAVTHRENQLRGLRGRMVTHCSQGHSYDEANTYVWNRPQGGTHRHCKRCAVDRYHRLAQDPAFRALRAMKERERRARLRLRRG